MKNTALTIAALALLAGFALAQPGPGATVPRMGGRMPMMEQTSKPELPAMTPEQLDKMDALRIAHLKEVLPLQTDLQIKEMELAALWRADKLDAKKIVAKVREISDARGKLELAKVNHRIDMYNLMTPEQRKAMRPGMMGPRGMRGMMGGPGMGRRIEKRIMMLNDDSGGQCPMGQCDPDNCPNCGMQ
jgi:Spy/CpxP family protein refolding chaperone